MSPFRRTDLAIDPDKICWPYSYRQDRKTEETQQEKVISSACLEVKQKNHLKHEQTGLASCAGQI